MRLRTLLLSLVLVAAASSAAAPAAGQTSTCAGQSGAYPPTAPALQASATSVRPGDTIVLTGVCMAANASVSLQFRAQAAGAPSTSLGTATTDANGSFSASVRIPTNAAPGAYVLAASDGIREVTLAVTVVAPGGATLPRTGLVYIVPLAIAAGALIAVGLFAVLTVRRQRAFA